MINLQFIGKISYKLVKRFIYFNDLGSNLTLHLHPADYRYLLDEYKEVHGNTESVIINGVLVEADTSELVPLKCVNIQKV